MKSKKRDILVYLAGAYTGNIDRNVKIARRYAINLWDKGYTVISPHLNTAFFEEYTTITTYEDFMEGDFNIIKRCDAIFFLPNWKNSKGSQRELKFARENNIKVRFLK